jgi:hypothetical protein
MIAAISLHLEVNEFEEQKSPRNPGAVGIYFPLLLWKSSLRPAEDLPLSKRTGGK